MTKEELESFFNQTNYDLRITGDARWIDQKCTPDVVCFLSDCILNFTVENPNNWFTVNDIWKSEYFKENVQGVFGKPNAENPNAENEYDKFINQPLKLLSYSKVLLCEKHSNTNFFKIEQLSLLEYIAARERNSFLFLVTYITKVLKDSDLLNHFLSFFEKSRRGIATSTDFSDLKTTYENFILSNTPIAQCVEIRRIFTKVINPLSVENRCQGTIRGRISTDAITYSELMYNRVNWRDTIKSKGLTRQEFEDTTSNNSEAIEYTNYLMQKAMNQIKRRYSTSEVIDEWGFGEATQVHHIFMKSEFPQISYFLENLIKLTPTQHYTKAHPSNNTQIIDREYQFVCLIAKSNSIEQSISRNEEFYSIENFIYIVNTGINSNLDSETTLDVVRKYLATAYNCQL
jgi:hypothetical protein